MLISPTASWRGMLALLFMVGLQAVQPAHAVPSYSRQTNSECAACHIGAFGPHLTPYGIRFKLGGYTDTDGKGGKIPLSMTVQLTSTETEIGNPSTRGKTDVRLSNVDIYLAGRLTENVGTYTRLSHSEGPAATDYTQLDDFDVRFAKEGKLGEREMIWGLSLNNHPGMQDPIDALPAWGFGAIGPGRDFVQGTRTGTLLNKYQGGLAHRVVGLTGYGYFDQHWYAEMGTYKSLSPSAQNKLGLPERVPGADVGDPGRLSKTLYWRAAYMHDMKTQFFSLGLVGLQTDLQSDRTGVSDRVKDLGADFMYEYLGTREHVVQLRASFIRESRRYGSLPTLSFYPPSVGGPVGLPTGSVRESTLAGTYAYRNTWGLTVARTFAKNSVDAARYLPFGQANTNFAFIAPFWNVWGKEGDSVPIGTNLQLGAWIYRVDKFNGGTQDIFGPGSGVRAKDFNSVLLYAKLAL